MPNRDFYLQDDAKLKDTRAKYQAHVEKMLALAGHTDAAVEAARIVALETAIAKAQWSAVENRDPVKAYNKLTARPAEGAGAGLRLDRLPERHGRGRQGRRGHRQPAVLPAGPGQDHRRHPARDLEVLLRLPPASAPTRLTCRSPSSTRASPSAARC